MFKEIVTEMLNEILGEILSEEELQEANYILEKSNKFEYIEEPLTESTGKYKGREVQIGKPMRGDVKKYKVYVKNEDGKVVKVNFGDKNMEIKRDNPERRKSFRARHKCSDKTDKTTPGYWSCKFWSTKNVSDLLNGK